ncbi:hypothetical protein GQ600_22238 [Phytophthora cactorum]|nr:hypothetical protein GQ600_22238 [Phytophthora cactorum]
MVDEESDVVLMLTETFLSHGKVLSEVRREVFQLLLLRLFNRYYYIPRHTSRGRPPKPRYHHQILGLGLCFYVGSMEQSTLCMVFRTPPSTPPRTLHPAEEALSKALTGYALARISWPSPSRPSELTKLV